MDKIKKYFFILLLLEMFFVYAPAYAQSAAQPATPVYSGGQQGVTDYLCTPDSKNVSGSPNGVLFACINQIYKFAIVVASVVGVFFIVIAGYIYMSADGNAESVDKAKDILVSTLTALVILFIGYVLLAAINPDLVKFNTIQPANVPLSVPTTGTTGPTTGTGVTSAACVTTQQGGCTTAVISQCPAMAQNMNAALSACNQESGGGQVAIASGTDKCTETTTNQVISFSWGLWQLNIAAGSTGSVFPECNGVLKEVAGPWNQLCTDGTTCGRTCTFGSGGVAAFNACTTALADPARNTQQACVLFNQSGWGPWPFTRKVCGLP